MAENPAVIGERNMYIVYKAKSFREIKKIDEKINPGFVVAMIINIENT